MKKFLLLFLFVFCGIVYNSYSQVTNLISPDSNSTCVSMSVTLKWNLVIGTNTYTVQVATDDHFQNIIIEKSGINQSTLTYDVTLPTANTMYYWRVACVSTVTNWSTIFNFTTTGASPTLVSPVNNTTCVQTTQKLTWNKAVNAIKYKVQVSTSANFTTPIYIDSTTLTSDTTFNLNLDQFSTTYFWRVAAIYIPCMSDYSAPLIFTTSQTYPTSTSPKNGDIGVSNTYKIHWTALAGVTSYDFQLSTSNTFTVNIVDLNQADTNINTATNNLTKGTKYFYRIRSKTATCTSPWSPAISYTTEYVKGKCLTPVNNESCVSLGDNKFVWNKIPGALTYRLQISTTPDFSLPIYGNYPNIPDTSFSKIPLANFKTFYWRVRADDNFSVGPWADSLTLTSTIAEPLMNTPTNGQKNIFPSVTIKWGAPTGAFKFYVQVATDSTYPKASIVLNDSTTDTQWSFFKNNLKGYNTKYACRVRTLFNGCLSDWSPNSFFTTIKGSPNLLTPADSSINVPTNTTFTWATADSAINGYDIVFSKDPAFNLLESIGGKGKTGNLYSPSQSFDEFTTYYWKMRTQNPWGVSPWSEVFQFTTGVGNIAAPCLIYPTQNLKKLDTTINFAWCRPKNTKSFEIQISEDQNFIKKLIDSSGITDTTITLGGLTNFTEYYWRVEATNSSDAKSGFSSPYKFRTIAEKITEKPNWVKPKMLDSVDYHLIPFVWTKIPFVLSREGKYNLQVATDSKFANIITINPLDLYDSTRSLTFQTTFDSLFAQVAGINEAGSGPWSDILQFRAYDSQLSVDIFDNNENLIIYPNPTTGSFLLKNDNNFEIKTIKIFDTKGNLISRFSNYITNFELSLAPNIYLMEIETSSKTFVKKLYIIK